MYQAYWGLSEPPFSAASAAAIEHSPQHAEALARLAFVAEHRSQLALLAGPAGSGKSLVLTHFARGQRAAGAAVALASAASLPARELLWEIAAGWGADPARGDDLGRLWRLATDRLAELRMEQVPALLIVDDADAANVDALRLVERIVQSPAAELTVVMAARELPLVRETQWLHALAELRIELALWTEDETRAYLQTTLARAGRDRPAFADTAVSRLFALSAGVPRRVNQLARLALVAGAGQKLEQVDEHTVEAAHEELCAAT
jgi:type II secretory pathway predicted ATPase ExeA